MLGEADATTEGDVLGVSLGAALPTFEGAADGEPDGEELGDPVGAELGIADAAFDG